MSTNKHITALDPSRLTASVHGMNPRLQGDGPPCAYAFGTQVLGINSTG